MPQLLKINAREPISTNIIPASTATKFVDKIKCGQTQTHNLKLNLYIAFAYHEGNCLLLSFPIVSHQTMVLQECKND